MGPSERAKLCVRDSSHWRSSWLEVRMAKNRNIIVIGTSAGGLEALDKLVQGLSAEIPASIFVVQHLPAEASGAALVIRLAKHHKFEPALAVNGESFRPGRLYIAPPNHHLLLKSDRMVVLRGARE